MILDVDPCRMPKGWHAGRVQEAGMELTDFSERDRPVQMETRDKYNNWQDANEWILKRKR